MFTRRLIAVSMIAVLTSAVPASVSAQHRRRQPPCPPPAKTYECPPYPLVEPPLTLPKDKDAPAPPLDSDRTERDDQAASPAQQPQTPDLARPTFTPSQSTTAATSSQSAAPNMIGDMLEPSAGVSLICIQPDSYFVQDPSQFVQFDSGYNIRSFAPVMGSFGDSQINRFVTISGTPGYAQFDINNAAGVVFASPIQFTSTSVVEGDPGLSPGAPISLGGDPLSAPPAPGAGTFFLIDQGGIDDLGAPDPADATEYSDAVTAQLQMTQPGLAQQEDDFEAVNGPGTFVDQGPGTVDLGPGYAILNVEDGDGIVDEDDTFYVQQVEEYVPDLSLYTPDPRLVMPPVIKIPIVNPASAPGALVGRQKIGENTSPLPRRRVFFNYSHFDSANIAPGGVNVNRYTPGLEWTFFDDNMSVEVRTPFASTLDSSMILGGRTSTDEIEFGNVTVNLKALLHEDKVFAMSTGLGISLPTADDVDVNAADGTRIVGIGNDAVHVLPFLGALWTPNDRCFAQAFVQFDFDTNGNPVALTSFNNGVATGNLQSVGIANDAALAYVDLSLGYWIYQNFNSCAKISGIAPMVELHFTGSVSDADIIQSSSGGATYQIGTNEDLEVLNAVFGLTTVLCDSSTLTLGYATPISEDDQFDGEFRAMLNIFFGGSRPGLGNRRFIQF